MNLQVFHDKGLGFGFGAEGLEALWEFGRFGHVGTHAGKSAAITDAGALNPQTGAVRAVDSRWEAP